MIGAIEAGGAYFLVAFMAGFVLGAGRTMLLAPRMGETAAVLIECPIILGLSWVICRWCVGVFQVAASSGARLGMGATAFALLLGAEAGVSALVARRTLRQHLAAYAAPAGAVGLAAQLLFATLPLVQLLIGRIHR